MKLWTPQRQLSILKYISYSHHFYLHNEYLIFIRWLWIAPLTFSFVTLIDPLEHFRNASSIWSSRNHENERHLITLRCEYVPCHSVSGNFSLTIHSITCDYFLFILSPLLNFMIIAPNFDPYILLIWNNFSWLSNSSYSI